MLNILEWRSFGIPLEHNLSIKLYGIYVYLSCMLFYLFIYFFFLHNNLVKPVCKTRCLKTAHLIMNAEEAVTI